MMKRFLIIMLAIMLALGNINVFAGLPYSPGIYEYTQNLNEYVSATDATVTADGAVLNDGGSVTYDFTLPFDAAKLTVTYSAAADTTFTVNAERSDYICNLSASETEKVIELFPERMGAFEVTFSASNAVTITNLVYTKVELSTDVIDSVKTVLEYPTEYEEALAASVVIPVDSNSILAKGAIRRVDMSDPNVRVTTVDGRIYMPIGTLAHALGLYYEDYTDLNYAYMSGENFVWYYKQGESWYEDTGKRINLNVSPVYINKILYVPVRAIAEAVGQTVDYRDGYAAVGMRTEVKNILHNQSIFTQLTTEMEQYIGEHEQGNVYHVAKSAVASDSNDGSESAPFATVQKAANVAQPGDTVIIHGGTYRESVTFPTDGTGKSPIIFKAAENENVVISAFDEVTGFTSYTNPANGQQMYKADISGLEFETTEPDTWTNDRNFIIYNDSTLLEGRHPNSDTSVTRTVNRYNYKKVNAETNPDGREDFTFVKAYDFNPYYPDLETNEILPTKGDMRFQDIIQKGSLGNPGTYQHVLYSDIDLNQTTPNYWQGATCMAMVGMGWSLVPSKVVSSEYGKATVEEYWFGGFGPTYYESKYASDYAWLTHHLNTVDMPGEWYIDNEAKLLYIIPPEGVSIENFKPEVKARQQVLDLTGRQYIQIENINTRGGGMTMNNAKGCILNGGKHKYISQVDESMHADVKKACIYHATQMLSGFSYQDDAPEYGEMGFYLGGDSNAIVNADIEYSAGAGIYVTGKNHYIYNNYVDKTGWGGSYATGIFVTRKGTEGQTTVKGGHQIYSNTSYGSYRAAIELEMGFERDGEKGNIIVMKPYDIAYNDLGWSNIAARDTGIYYQWGTVGGDDKERSKFHHNTVHDSVSVNIDSALSTNIYSDGLTSGFHFYDNMVYCTNGDEKFITEKYFYNPSELNSDSRPVWSNWTDNGTYPDGFVPTAIEYPNAMAFKIGAVRDENERFMDNYNKVLINDVVMLGDAELIGSAYTDNDGYVVLPDSQGYVSGSVELSNTGSYIKVYYSDDLYARDELEKLPTLTLSIYQNGNLVYKKSKLISKVGRNLDSTENISFQVPANISGNATFRISSDKDGIRFRKLSATSFDYNGKNAEQFFKYQSTPIAFGTADEVVIISTGNGRPAKLTNMTTDAFENYTYYGYKNAWKNDFCFYNRELTEDATKVMIAVAANGSTRNQRAVITVTDGSGETKAVAEIDCSTAFGENDGWHTEYITTDLSNTLQKGIYNIKVDFTESNPTDAYAILFF